MGASRMVKGKMQAIGAKVLIAAFVAVLALTCAAGIGSAWADSGTPLTTAANATAGKTGPIADGDYAIQSALNRGKVADVAGNSKSEYANVQIYDWNRTTAQRWHFTYNAAGGYYTITCKNSNKALTASANRSGANVYMRDNRNWTSQRWIVEKNGGFYIVRSAMNKNLVLDVSGASTRNGANIQVYKSNNTKAQRFAIASFDVPASTANIETGAYTITAACSGKVLDVSGASRSNGGNVQQYAFNGTYAQRFWIEPAGKGYYRIFNIGSGLALDVSGASMANGANVQQYGWNGTAAQLWSISKNTDGTYTFTSVCSGKVLDVAGASSKSGANIWQYTSNGTAAQRFKLSKTNLLSPGVVVLTGAFSTGRVIDIPGASRSAGVQLQMYSANGTQAQKYVVADEGDGAYTLQSCASGLYVGSNGKGAIVQQKAKYLWGVSYATSGSRRGIMFTSSDGKTAIAATGGGQGAKLRTEAPANKSTHMFLPSSSQIISEGYYLIQTALGNRVLDISGGSSQVGANVQIYQPNKTAAQVFYIANAGGGYYTITNAGSKKAVAVENGSTKSGANVKQLAAGKDASKLWLPTLMSDGSLTFKNKASGNLLTVANNTNANSSNVASVASNGKAGQRWYLTATSEPSNLSSVAQRALSKISWKSSDTSYMVAVDLTNHYVMIFRGSSGSWKFDRGFQCTNGAAHSPTVTGDFSIGAKGYSFSGSSYTCYYYTQFYADYLFHSVLYYLNSNTIKEGRLGMYLSAGCIRLAIENAKWIQDNVPYGSHVYIYN